MDLKAHLRSGIAAICIATMAAPTGFAETSAVVRPGAGPLAISVAQSKDFSRIEFRWAGGARITTRRDGQKLTVRFSRYARPDMSRLRIDPPRWLKTAQDSQSGGGLQLVLTLADDADARTGQADGAAFINLFEKKKPDAAPAPAPTPPSPEQKTQAIASNRPDPTPASGVVRMQAQMVGGQVQLRFPWRAPLGAAVFRRGEAVWVVFDTPAKLDLSGAPHGFRQVGGMQAVQGADFSAVRIAVPADVPYFASGPGSIWTLTLGAGSTPTADLIKVSRDENAPSATLSAAVAGATKVVWLNDPVVGDRIAAVTALAPSKGLPSRREYVDLALLPSAQGLAVEPIADDIAVASDGDLVNIGRPRGLQLSANSDRPQPAADETLGLPQPTTRPALIDSENWSKTGSGGFLARYDALQSAVAAEMGAGKDAGVAARMGLARFLIGSELSFEAIGVLNMTAKAQQNLLADAEFRGLRGAAKAMAGRYKEAEADFSVPALTDDPASSLWRGYIADKLGQYAEARTQFAAGAAALFQFSPKWRTRFATADADSATALGQYPVAEVALENALRGQDDPLEQLPARLVQARLLEAEGQKDRALGIYQAVATSNLGWLSAPALLHATQIQLDQNKITPTQAADVYDSLRYRWRGDATELDTIRALGQIYISLGRYREALEALRSAGQRLPDLPQAVQLQTDLNNAFRTLFLDGQADGLQPIQALALFYDFKELTPIGADGDLIVRKLARRLVDVDLLGQAAELLKYQADNRLDGVPRAEVSTDLATIDLMNRQPEAALDALNTSRTTLLPNALNAQRRIVESRAWLGLGQYDHALEIIQSDKSADAETIRAEVSWKKHDWPNAGGQFERMLGDRWKTPGALNSGDEARLLRAAVAYSLAGDDGSLGRMRDHYQGFIAQAHSPDALKVALSGMNGAEITSTDFSRTVAENDTFASWVQLMKQRFKEAPAPVSDGRAVKTAQALGAAKG
jgi:tetratricopeptide (TPR) repeat protein